MALYFATRGIGIVRTPDGTAQPYHSRARVVISGLGSDELLGGYSRHRLAFQNGGWQGLIDEVRLSSASNSIYCHNICLSATARNFPNTDAQHGPGRSHDFLSRQRVAVSVPLALSRLVPRVATRAREGGPSVRKWGRRQDAAPCCGEGIRSDARKPPEEARDAVRKPQCADGGRGSKSWRRRYTLSPGVLLTHEFYQDCSHIVCQSAASSFIGLGGLLDFLYAPLLSCRRRSL